MSNYKASTAQARLGQVKDFLTGNMSATTIPFDPNATKFPSRKDIPQPAYAPKGLPTSWVWGENDQIGRLNLLTPTRIKAAAKSEIQSGEMVSLKYASISSPSILSSIDTHTIYQPPPQSPHHSRFRPPALPSRDQTPRRERGL